MIHLYRMGTDPEFVFARIIDGMPMLVSAQEVISANKDLTLKSFIGTDGHASTAEIRPNPANNIRRIMFELASAMVAVGKFLETRKKWANTFAMAHPVVANETLGGHIHCSFWVKDPVLAKVRAHGQWYGGYEFSAYPKENPIPIEDHAVIHDELVIREKSDNVFTPQQFVRVMGYLLLPFDMWCQNWTLRKQRMKSGSHVSEPFRINYSKPNKTLSEGRFKEYAYYHIEYRSPSTWLVHPWLAYAYLALGKFTMLNYDRILSLAQKKGGKKKSLTMTGADSGGIALPVADNDQSKATFIERFTGLVEGGARVTPDLEDLATAVAKVERWRERWVNPQTTIQFGAWSKLV